MTAKEDKLLPRGASARVGFVMSLTENAIRFFLAAVLAGAELFGGFAMGGVAIVAASGGGASGFAALLGAGFGYLCFQGFVGGLRYLAACVLVYAVSFAFCDTPFLRRSWCMPAVAAGVNGLVGFVYLSEGGWTSPQVIWFATEVGLTASLTLLYRTAFTVWDDPREEGLLSPRQIVGLMAVACSALVTLEQVTLLDSLSLGRILAALVTLLAGWRGGVGTGAAVGISVGLAMDLTSLTAPACAMAFPFSGMMAGVFRRQGRMMTAICFVIANAAAVLWTWQHDPQLALLYEVFSASLCFLFLPEKLLRRLSALVRCDSLPDSAVRARAYTAERLNRSAAACRDLSRELEEAVQAAAPARPSFPAVFDRAADRVCAGCALREVCWGRDYQSTRTALNDALPTLLDKGRGGPSDYPGWFASRCVEFRSFMSAVNEELAAQFARQQYQSRARANRSAVCRQYDQLATVLEQAARQLQVEPVPDPARQRRVQQRLAALGLEGESAVYYDEHGHLRVEIAGTKLTVLDNSEERAALSSLMGVPLRPEEGRRKDGLCLVQSEPFLAVVGVAAREKEGQSVSGDAGAWFKDEAGRLHIFLCDGMGCGKEARADSTFAVDLLEKFLRAGVEPEEALRTLSDSLALRGEERGGFTTIDLLRLDLFTGEGALYKLGASPSFLRVNGEVLRLTGQTLPAGVNVQNSRPDVLPLKLSAGDWLVMASDGVTGTEDDWVAAHLQSWEGDSPRLLARDLLEGASARRTVGDDRTVVALKLANRP